MKKEIKNVEKINNPKIRSREEILNDSPFFNSFLKNSATDYMIWVAETSPSLTTVTNELNKYLNGGFEEKAVLPLLSEADSKNVFDKDCMDNKKRLATTSLLAIGFEVGNIEEIKLFSFEISDKLIKLGLFGKDKNLADKISSYIFAALYKGVSWKEGLIKQFSTSLGPFEDAIGKLDLDI